MNTLGAVSRLGQWRFRHVFRGADERSRLDISDAGLIDFSTCSEVLLTVTPRAPHRGCWSGHPPDPVMTASFAAGSLVISNPRPRRGGVPRWVATRRAAGLYDVRIFVTIGQGTEEVFCEPVEFA